MNQFYSALTIIFDFMATGTGEPDTLAMGIGAATLVVITILIAIVGWKKASPQDKQEVKDYLWEAVSSGHVGEHVSGEDEGPEDEHPAMADSMPQPKLRQQKPSPATQPQNPRLHLVATITEKDGHLAHFTTKRRAPRTGKVEKYRSQDLAVMVNQGGNRYWVRP